MKYIKKCSWDDVKNRVAECHKELFDLIEAIPGELPPLHLAAYYYGECIVKDGYFRCDNIEVNEELSYSPIPLMFALNKDMSCTYRHNLGPEKVHYLTQKGTLMGLRGFARNSPIHFKHLNIYLGSRGVFLDDRFSNINYFQRLRSHYKYNFQLPMTHHDHFQFFKEISQLDSSLKKWQADVVIFDKHWAKLIRNDTRFRDLLIYLLRYEGERLETISAAFDNFMMRNHSLSHVLKARGLKPKYFEQEILEQLILISLGYSSGIRPVTSVESFPINAMKKILEEVYDKRDWAVFLHVGRISDIRTDPVYLSLSVLYLLMGFEEQYKIRSNLSELINIEYIISKIRHSIDGLNDISFKFFHSQIKSVQDSLLHPSLIDNDPQLIKIYGQIEKPFRSSFWRGVVQLKYDDKLQSDLKLPLNS